MNVNNRKGMAIVSAPLGEDAPAMHQRREPGDEPSDASIDAIPMEEMERDGVAAPDYANGVGAAQLVVKPVMAD